jgi:hypothetical protein
VVVILWLWVQNRFAWFLAKRQSKPALDRAR